MIPLWSVPLFAVMYRIHFLPGLGCGRKTTIRFGELNCICICSAFLRLFSRPFDVFFLDFLKIQVNFTGTMRSICCEVSDIFSVPGRDADSRTTIRFGNW